MCLCGDASEKAADFDRLVFGIGFETSV